LPTDKSAPHACIRLIQGFTLYLIITDSGAECNTQNERYETAGDQHHGSRLKNQGKGSGAAAWYEFKRYRQSFKITLDDEQRLRIADYCILHNVPKEYLMSQLRYTEKVQARGNLRNAKRFIIAGLERNYPTTQPTPKQPDQLETVNNSKPKEVERTDPLIHHFVTNAWQYIDKR
jgi:hypothetical protein